MRFTGAKFKVSAPAAMILAAAVTTAVSSEAVIAPAQPGFSWAVQPGAGVGTRNARAFLAQQAAKQIRDQDRHSGATPARIASFDFFDARDVVVTDCRSESTPSLNHVISTYQHAAP